jgi:hypothetical protein
MSQPYLGCVGVRHRPPTRRKMRGRLFPQYSTNRKCTDLCLGCSWGLTLERRRSLRSSEGSGCLLLSHPIIASQSYWGVLEAKSNGALTWSDEVRELEGVGWSYGKHRNRINKMVAQVGLGWWGPRYEDEDEDEDGGRLRRVS